MLISKKNRREVYKYLFKGELECRPQSPRMVRGCMHRDRSRAAKAGMPVPASTAGPMPPDRGGTRRACQSGAWQSGNCRAPSTWPCRQHGSRSGLTPRGRSCPRPWPPTSAQAPSPLPPPRRGRAVRGEGLQPAEAPRDRCAQPGGHQADAGAGAAPLRASCRRVRPRPAHEPLRRPQLRYMRECAGVRRTLASQGPRAEALWLPCRLRPQSFKSKEYVTERYAWRHFYW